MSNENFWNDDKVKEFVRWNFDRQDHNYLPAALEQFKQGQLSKRDWEILSWIYGETVYFDSKVIAGVVDAKIRSVRRLSDGEVFAIKDDTHKGVIKRFWIDDDIDVLFAEFEDGKNLQLKFLQKAKKQVLLFVTEDGKKIFEGDACWWVNDGFGHGIEKYVTKTQANSEDYKRLIKWFSTKESAEEYIINNKPLFSVNEITAWHNKNFVGSNVEFWISLKQLAKSKMDKK